MSKAGRRWRQARERDPYIRQARAEGRRSRAAYKLRELDARHRLLRPGCRVCDLGAAPGGWSQYAAERCAPNGAVLAVDILPMPPVEGALFIQGDFTAAATQERCQAALDGRRLDLVLSDMAPNLSGIRDADQARSAALAESVLQFARRALQPGGGLLVKLFQGAEAAAYMKKVGGEFQTLVSCKPWASKAASREWYLLARGYKGGGENSRDTHTRHTQTHIRDTHRSDTIAATHRDEARTAWQKI